MLSTRSRKSINSISLSTNGLCLTVQHHSDCVERSTLELNVREDWRRSDSADCAGGPQSHRESQNDFVSLGRVASETILKTEYTQKEGGRLAISVAQSVLNLYHRCLAVQSRVDYVVIWTFGHGSTFDG